MPPGGKRVAVWRDIRAVRNILLLLKKHIANETHSLNFWRGIKSLQSILGPKRRRVMNLYTVSILTQTEYKFRFERQIGRAMSIVCNAKSRGQSPGETVNSLRRSC